MTEVTDTNIRAIGFHVEAIVFKKTLEKLHSSSLIEKQRVPTIIF